MKNRIFKSILVLVMAFFAIPIFAQDAVVVFFKDGNFRKFYLRDIVEISTSQYDEYGTAHSDYQYQHIITKSEKFVYDLSNINSIGFSKYDDAKAEQNFVEAMPKVANALSDCETISDAETQINQIKGQQGVEDAWSDGHQLYVKIEEGETFSFHFDHSVEIDGDWMESGNYQNFAKAMASKVKRANASVNSQVKVVVANQQHYDESRVSHTTDFLEPLLQAFRDCGFVADYVKDPTVDFFYDNSSDPNNLHIYDYDIILLVTHGAYLEPKYLATKGGFWRDFHEEVANYDLKCHAIMTSEVIDNLPIKGEYNDKWKECYAKFKAWRDKSQFQNVSDIDLSFEFMKEERGGENRWIAHPVLTEYFFRHIATGRFHDNSILFNTACQSLLSDGGPEIPSYSFANEFFDKNLSLYAGYTEENFLGTDVMAMFLNRMLDRGQSIGFVYDDLPAYFKLESKENIEKSNLPDKTRQKIYDDGGPKNAELLILPDGNIETRLRFLFGVYTNEKDQSSVTQEFNTDKAVTISSTLTANKPEYINAGFYYSTDENNLSENVKASFKRNIDNQGKGNCEFVATLTNLEPGKTYFYRAYTYDGVNYNYGEICSFEIPEQPADEKQVMLTQNVGGNTYEIYKINTDKNDYHINPDGWKCYKSSLMLDITKNGKTSTYTLDDNIYLDSSESHHGGQRPCLYISSSSDQLFVFINSKDSRNNYTMDGYAYRTSLSNVSFTRETVFTGRNWGWSPYFTYSDGVLSVQHFSYAGYYAMTSYRNSDGTWTTKQGNYIKPDAFNEQSEQAGNVLIDDNPGLALSQTQLSIVAGGSTTVEITSGSGVYGVTNLNSSIARGTLQGTTVTIDGVAVGNDAKIVVTDMQTGLQIIITVTVTGSSGSIDANGHEYVDLGLPSGVKWASCNVGATKPEEYGSYFSWGETEEKDTYDWSTYKWCKGSWNTQTKYCTKSSYGTIDNKTVLDPGDDVAHVKWGGSWRMPTQDEFQELYDNCNIEWTTINGVKGRKFTSNTNGNFIFFPTAGRIDNSGLNDVGDVGYFWSSSLNVTSPYCARRMYFEGTMFYFYSVDRYHGQSVRPVCK